MADTVTFDFAPTAYETERQKQAKQTPKKFASEGKKQLAIATRRYAMTPVELRQSRANVAAYMIRMYYHDLSEYYAGDEGRWNRMVVDAGKGLPTAHPHGWAQHIVNCTTAEAVEFYRDELVAIYQQLIAWRLVAVMPPQLDILNGDNHESSNRTHL